MSAPPWHARGMMRCILAVALVVALATSTQAEGATHGAAAAAPAKLASTPAAPLKATATVASASPLRAASASLPSAVAAPARTRKPLPPVKFAAAAGSAAASSSNSHAATPAAGSSKLPTGSFSRLRSTVRPPQVMSGGSAAATATTARSASSPPRTPPKATVVQELVARAVGTKPVAAAASGPVRTTPSTTLGANGHGRAPVAAPKMSPTLFARVQENTAAQLPPPTVAHTPPSSQAGAVAVAEAQERQAAMAAAAAAAQRDPIAAAVSAGASDDAAPPLARLPDEKPTAVQTPVPAASEARSNDDVKQPLSASVTASATRVPPASSPAAVASSSPSSLPPPATVPPKLAVVFKDGKISPEAAAAAASHPKLSARELEEEAELEAALAEFEAANPSESSPSGSIVNVRDKVMANRQKMKERAGQPLHSEFPQRSTNADNTQARPGLDTSHAVGDLDVLRALSHPHPSVGDQVARVSSAWLPAHGALIFILLFSLMCVRRVVSLCRGTSSTASNNSWRAKVAYALQALSTFIWDKKEPGLDSPVGNERTRDLAALSFVDGQSRMRRGVKAGTGTISKQQELTPGGGDIEMQSMTSSLASLHIPKMLYMDAAGNLEDSASSGAESPAPPQTVLTPQLLQLLLPYLPSSSHIQDLACKYKLSVNGASLADLYRRCGKVQDSLTIIQARQTLAQRGRSSVGAIRRRRAS